MICIFTDGGARGNPGPAGIGVYAVDGNQKKIFSVGKPIGVATNNSAEYQALLEGLTWLSHQKKILATKPEIYFYLDSNLVVSQVNGLFKVKNSKLLELLIKVREKEADVGLPIRYSHIPREKNKHADFLVNKALDNNKEVF